MSEQLALPGLATAGAPANSMQLAARTYLEHLQSLGKLEPQHGLTVQLVLELSTVVGKAAAKGQAAAMSMASRELREAMATLPAPASSDAFAAFMAELSGEQAAA